MGGAAKAGATATRGRRAGSGQIRQGAIIHGETRREAGVCEHALPQGFRDQFAAIGGVYRRLRQVRNLLNSPFRGKDEMAATLPPFRTPSEAGVPSLAFFEEKQCTFLHSLPCFG